MSDDFNLYFTNEQRNITTLEPPTTNQNNIINTNFPNSEEIANKVVAAIHPMLTRLTNEVQSMRKELQVLKKEKAEIKRTVMPDEPFKEIELFFDFEKQLQENSENFAFFEKELTLVAKTPNFTKNCKRKLITDVLGEQLCWKALNQRKVYEILAQQRQYEVQHCPLEYQRISL